MLDTILSALLPMVVTFLEEAYADLLFKRSNLEA